MIYLRTEYNQGFKAALSGKTEKDCPYEEPKRQEGVYSYGLYDEWMAGFRGGKKACPHCEGTV